MRLVAVAAALFLSGCFGAPPTPDDYDRWYRSVFPEGPPPGTTLVAGTAVSQLLPQLETIYLDGTRDRAWPETWQPVEKSVVRERFAYGKWPFPEGPGVRYLTGDCGNYRCTVALGPGASEFHLVAEQKWN